MKVVILAGGRGTRISEESGLRPKPMVEIGGRPILWHIMKLYSSYGFCDFVICCGYKGYVIKNYFANYFLHMSDVTIDIGNNSIEVHRKNGEPWKVTLVDTGESTQTGGRIKRVESYIDDDFCLTYGDGLANIDIGRLVAFHKTHGKLATVSAVQPPGRFGSLQIEDDTVRKFHEKPIGDGGYVNGGFFVLSPKIMDMLDKSDATVWEREPLERLAASANLLCFRHDGFWQPMDTMRDKEILETMWTSGQAPWKTWT